MRKLTILTSVLVATLITTGSFVAHAQSSIDKIKSATQEAANKAENYFDDSTLTTEIKSKFLAESALDSMNISVETTGGVVVLTGIVDNAAQSRLAEMIAQSTKSVKMVNNKLTVKK